MVANPAHPAHRDDEDHPVAVFRLDPAAPRISPTEAIESRGLSFTALGIYMRLDALADDDGRFRLADLTRGFPDPPGEVAEGLAELRGAGLVIEVAP